jgi:hypothetical protein
MLNERDSPDPTAVDPRVWAPLGPPDHDLRQGKRRLDVAPLRDLVKDGDRPALGRTAEDPVRVMKRPCLPFHDHLADRDVMAAAQVHVAFRDVLDLSLTSRWPVPRGLSPGRRRGGVARDQALFAQGVTPARASGLIRDRLRLTDATPVLATIAVPSTLRWVAQPRQRWWDAARPQGAPPAWQPVSASLGWEKDVVRPHARRRTPPS